MSLASKLANLFSPLQAQLTPNDQSISRSQFASSQPDASHSPDPRHAESRRSFNMEEEEEVRHPYVHVSRSFDRWELWLKGCSVHAGRRSGRHFW